MRLELRNILKIESADIDLGGLTVLTGENDSGKSTVGKVLFSVLKTAANVSRIDKARTYSKVRIELASLLRMFSGDGIDWDLKTLTESLVEREMPVGEFEKMLLAKGAEAGFSTRMNVLARTKCARIHSHILRLSNPDVAVMDEFARISASEFEEPLNTYGTSAASITFHDDSADASGSRIGIGITEGKVTSASLCGEISVEDVTYIESPLYLHVLNALRMPGGILPRARLRDGIPYHLADMAEKMVNMQGYAGTLFDSLLPWRDSLLSEISAVAGGEFVVDNKTRRLTFSRGGHPLPPLSVASGIKSFGVLQRLIQVDAVSPSRMLVWDEPEIHLHPEWQLTFCRLAVEMVANGIPVVISSHSPYFIQGLRYYAALRGVEGDVRYYMASNSADNLTSRFREVTGDLNGVFTRLAAPLREVMNVDEARTRRP